MEKAFLTSSSSFEELVSGEYFFVDKSLLIEAILQKKSGAFLFTRPRRFGKSTNLDMLDHFFNSNYKDENIFDSLKISKSKYYEEHLHQYQVIHLDFGSLDADSFELMRKRLLMIIPLVAGQFQDIRNNEEISEYELRLYDRIATGEIDDAGLIDSIKLLCKWISSTYHKETVILIDEYDKPINSAIVNGFYDELSSIIKPFLESTLKLNKDYKFAIITGVSRITKESIFSGLNNLDEFDIFQSRYDEYFGFTENEVSSLLDEAELPGSLMGGIREYYDGYRFGDCDIYNPYSVIRFLDSAYTGDVKFQPHWVNSGDTSMIVDLLRKTTPDYRDKIVSLGINNNAIHTGLNPYLSYKALNSSDEKDLEEAILTMMVTSGYLKAIPSDLPMYDVQIPNMEVLTAFRQMMIKMNSIDEGRMSTFIKSLVKGDSESATRDLNIIMDGMSPKDHYDEYIHKITLSSILGYSGYRYQNELGSGNGFIDMYVSSSDNRPGILIELKYTNSEFEDLSDLASDALYQISSKEYSRNIHEKHIKVGIAFHKHSAFVKLSQSEMK